MTLGVEIPDLKSFNKLIFKHKTAKDPERNTGLVESNYAESVISLQESLKANERLMLTVDLSLPVGVDVSQLKGYEKHQYEERIKLRFILEKLIKDKVIFNQFILQNHKDEQPLPDKIEILIPPNVYPENSDDGHISAFKSTLGGEVREFLTDYSPRYSGEEKGRLFLNATGAFLGDELFIPISSISKIKVKKVHTVPNSTPICTFKAIKPSSFLKILQR